MANHSMKFQDEHEKQKFIHDEKYFGNLNSYCLGNTLEEAGDILRKITEAKEVQQDENSESQL